MFLSMRLGVRGLLVGSLIEAVAAAAFAQPVVPVQDRSGTEIFSIIQSEIKSLRFENSKSRIEITRRERNRDVFSVSIGRKGGEMHQTPAISRKRLLSFLNGFADVRALKRTTISKADKVLGKMVIQDFSDLEPAEFDYFLANDGMVVLNLNSSESYVVDLPASIFQKLEAAMKTK